MRSAVVVILDEQLSSRINIFEKVQEFGIIGAVGGNQMRLVISKTKDGKFYIEYLVPLRNTMGYRLDNYPYSYDELLEKLSNLLIVYGDNVILSVALVQYDFYVSKLEYSNGVSQDSNNPSYVRIIDGDKIAYPKMPSIRNIVNEKGEEVQGISIPGDVLGCNIEYTGTIKE